MLLLIVGLVLFIGIHSVSIVAEGFRNQMVEKSEIAWKLGYTIASLAGLVLIIRGYADARLDPIFLYATPGWMRHLVSFLLLPVFILFFASYLPGKISAVTKHPQLIAIKLWALSHLLVNGTVADVLLFGSFLAWAVATRISLKRRTPRPLPGLPASGINDVIVIVLGLGLYLVFAMWLHVRWIGVSPFG